MAVTNTNLPVMTGSPTANGRERRHFQRVRGPFDAECRGTGGTGTVRVWDLSLGGCYIDSLSQQRCGERINLTISLPEGLVAAEGEVVYSVPNQGFAIRFLGLPDHMLGLVSQAVDRLVAAGQGV